MQEITAQAVLLVTVALKVLLVAGVIPEVLPVLAAVMRAAVQVVLRVPQMQQPVLLEVLVAAAQTSPMHTEVMVEMAGLCSLLLVMVARVQICISARVKHPVLRELHRQMLNKAVVVAAAAARQCNTTEK